MATQSDVCKMLFEKSGIEVLEAHETPKRLRLLARLHRTHLDQWKLVLRQLLRAARAGVWTADISKMYFLREPSDQVYYTWRILLQGEDLASHYGEVLSAIEGTPVPSSVTVEEMPLMGADPRRNTRTNVGPVDRVMIGPLAVQKKMMGG